MGGEDKTSPLTPLQQVGEGNLQPHEGAAKE